MQRSQKGSTLIELLVVLAILGVLGGVVTVAAGEFVDRFAVAACRFERRSLVSAIERAARAANARGEAPPLAGPDGLDGVRLAGFLRWDPVPRYWEYRRPPGAPLGENVLFRRVGTASIPESACS